MSSVYIQRQKIRSWQIVLLTVGGVLMFWGFYLYRHSENVHKGFQAVRAESWHEAYEAFEGDDRLETYAGRGLALLGMDRGIEADAVHAYIHETLAEGRTPAERVRVWQEQNPRDWGKYKGYFLYFDAWYRAELIFRAYRIGESQEYITDLNSDYEQDLATFSDWVDEVQDRVVEPTYWATSRAALLERMANPDRSNAVQRARSRLGAPLEISKNTAEQLETAYEPALRRGVKEDPEGVAVRGWNLMVLCQLSKLDHTMKSGRNPKRLLADSFREGAALEKRRWELVNRGSGEKDDPRNYTPTVPEMRDSARFLVAMMWAAKLLAKFDRGNAADYEALSGGFNQKASQVINELLAKGAGDEALDSILALHRDLNLGKD